MNLMAYAWNGGRRATALIVFVTLVMATAACCTGVVFMLPVLFPVPSAADEETDGDDSSTS